VIVDGRAHLDLLDLDDLLLLAGLVGLFLLLVFELAVVHQLADRRLVVGRDFDDVKTLLVAQSESFVQADLAVLVAVVADQKNGFGGDFVVDARAILGRRGCVTLKTSGDYDSLLLLRPRPFCIRQKWSRFARGVQPASRNGFRSWAQMGSS
jgi:hypothetical protein